MLHSSINVRSLLDSLNKLYIELNQQPNCTLDFKEDRDLYADRFIEYVAQIGEALYRTAEVCVDISLKRNIEVRGQSIDIFPDYVDEANKRLYNLKFNLVDSGEDEEGLAAYDPESEEIEVYKEVFIENSEYLLEIGFQPYLLHVLLHESTHAATVQIIRDLSYPFEDYAARMHGPIFIMSTTASYLNMGLIHEGLYMQTSMWMRGVTSSIETNSVFLESHKGNEYAWEDCLTNIDLNVWRREASKSGILYLPKKLVENVPDFVEQLLKSDDTRRNGALKLEQDIRKQNLNTVDARSEVVLTEDGEWDLLKSEAGFDIQKLVLLGNSGLSTKVNRVIVDVRQPYMMCVRNSFGKLMFLYNDLMFGLSEISLAEAWLILNT